MNNIAHTNSSKSEINFEQKLKELDTGLKNDFLDISKPVDTLNSDATTLAVHRKIMDSFLDLGNKSVPFLDYFIVTEANTHMFLILTILCRI